MILPDPTPPFVREALRFTWVCSWTGQRLKCFVNSGLEMLSKMQAHGCTGKHAAGEARRYHVEDRYEVSSL